MPSKEWRKQFELERKRAQVQHTPDIELRALKLWGDAVDGDTSLEDYEITRREKAGWWLNEYYECVRGKHPYTEQQISEKMMQLKN